MAREPELSIKVKVDPVIDDKKLGDNIQGQIDNIKNLPAVPVKPDISGFQDTIKDNLGGPYNVGLNPNFETSIADKVTEEIGKIDKDTLKIDIKPDLEGFSTQLSEALRDELKEVNQKLSYYLKNLTANSNSLSSLVNDILPVKKVKSAAKQAANEVTNELTSGLNHKIKIDDFLNYKISDSTKRKSLNQVKNLVSEISSTLKSLQYSDDYYGENNTLLSDKYQKDFDELKSKALDLRSIIQSFDDSLSSKNGKSIKSLFLKNGFDLDSNVGDFYSIEQFLNYIISFQSKFKNTDVIEKFFDSIDNILSNITNDPQTTYEDIFTGAVNELDSVQKKTAEINANIKTANVEIKNTQKELQSAQKNDESGHLDASTIETYGQKLDEVLSKIAAKQELINTYREKAIGLENSILSATIFTRENLSKELVEYDALFEKYDTDKISKFADSINLADFIKNQEIKMQAAQGNSEKNQIENGVYNVTDVKFNIEPEILQLKVDAAFKDISAPIDLHLKKDAAKHVKDELTTALADFNAPDVSKDTDSAVGNTDHTVPVAGKVVITDTDVTVDIKKPVRIPGEAIVDKAATIDTSKITITGEPVDVPVKATLKETDISVPETPIPVKVTAELTETNVNAATKKPRKSNKTTKQSEQQSSVDLTGKIALEPKDITPPETPVEIPGHVTLTTENITVPDSIDLNGNLVIKNATKEIKAATKEAEDVVDKETNKKSKKDNKAAQKRQKKEYLNDWASLSKKIARAENTRDEMYPGADDYKEMSKYIDDLKGRRSTTETLLNKLVGNDTWKNDSLYASGKKDAEHIRNQKIADSKVAEEIKNGIREEKEYKDTLEEIPQLEEKAANALQNFGDASQHYKDANDKLIDARNTISAFESKYSESYSDLLRSEVLEEQKKNKLRAQEAADKKARESEEAAANKKRIEDEQRYLKELAQEPKLQQDVIDFQRDRGDNDYLTKRAIKDRDKNHASVTAFENSLTTQKRNLSDIPGYAEVVEANSRSWEDWHQKVQDNSVAQRDKATKQAEAEQKAIEKSSADMVSRVEKIIEANKKNYLAAEKEIAEWQTQLSATNDSSTRQDILDKISEAKDKKKFSGHTINLFKDNYTGLVQNAWDEINSEKKSRQIKQNEEYEAKSSKEASATRKENLNLLKQYNQSLNEELKLLKQVYTAETVEGKAAAQNALNDQKSKTENLRNQLKGKGLDATSEYQKYNTQNTLNEAAINAKYNKPDIDSLVKKYIANMRERDDFINKISTVTDSDLANRMSQKIEENNKAIQEAGFELAKLGQNAADAWKEIDKVRLELDYKNDQAFNKALDAQNKELEKNVSDDEKLLNRIDRAMRNREKAYNSYLSADVDSPADVEAKKGRFSGQSAKLVELQQEAAVRGLTSSQVYIDLQDQHQKEINAITEAHRKRIEAEQEAIRVQDEDRLSILNYIKTVEKYKNRLEQDNHTDNAVYGDSVNMANRATDLLDMLNKNPDNKDQIAYLWGQKYNIQGVTDLESAFKALAVEAAKADIKVQDLRTETEKLRAETQARTNIANLKSQLMDYLNKFPKVESGLADKVKKLQDALNDPNAYKNAGRLKQQMAELRAQAKQLGLESENLLDKFKNLFGQHLSTMITMVALHQMQSALQIVYQNVVEIDTAVTELRKVSEYAGKSLEEYMGRAAEQAQKLGVSISDYINSTADWKRLGYSDKDAENLATYSTLLRNVGDGIDDVNTSSSYLISTLKGFGLLASDAEDVVDKIDAVANTQPVTANDLGEILTRSSAAMSAANNTLEETLALGTAANSVLQDADSVGTMMKSLSMYLRAAKTDAENAGIEVDGMATSVSELRSELKSLTGVDIMLDSKNFKSTYQIMKELSQVWSSLSDVTQANVTEMIAGKRNANGVAAILNNFDVAESTMESAANSANVAWAENEKYLDSIQGRLAQLDASFQALSTDVLKSDLVKYAVSFLSTIVKISDNIVNLAGVLPLVFGGGSFAVQLGEPKMTGFMIVPSNTPGGDTEQVLRRYYMRSMREYLAKPTNMAA